MLGWEVFFFGFGCRPVTVPTKSIIATFRTVTLVHLCLSNDLWSFPLPIISGQSCCSQTAILSLCKQPCNSSAAPFHLYPWLTTTMIPTAVSFFLRTHRTHALILTLPSEYPQQGERSDYVNWDTKSYQSSFVGSQAHLMPYEMSQVSVSQHYAPPVPAVPYQQYPPQQPAQHIYPQHTGYSDAREKLLKRRSVRQVNLDKGNLVVEVPVPSSIIPASTQGSERDEMTKLRYTAATCDPDVFKASKYSLRPYLMGRRTELFIVMTMYNEDEVLFVKTMNAYVTLKVLLLRAFMYLW